MLHLGDVGSPKRAPKTGPKSVKTPESLQELILAYFGQVWGSKNMPLGTLVSYFGKVFFGVVFRGGLRAPAADRNRFRGPPRGDLGRRNLLPKLFGYIIRIPLSF